MDNPANFSKFNQNSPREANYFLKRYESLFKWDEAEDVLEIGSADGRIAKDILYPFIGDRLRSLVGSDISQPSVHVANVMHKKDKLRFERIDVTDENDTEPYYEKFGHVFAFFCFHMIPRPEKWSKNIFNMLKSKGQLFASIIIQPHPYPSTAKAQKADVNAPWAKYLENCPDLFIDYRPEPIEKIKGILTKAGFKVDMIEIVENENLKSVYPTLETLNGTMLSVNSFLRHIPEDLKAAYIEDFVTKLQQFVQKGENGSYFFQKKVLAVLATKP